MRNPHNFSWWALVNAASTYGHGGSNMGIFFALALTQTSMLRKLNAINVYHLIAKLTIETFRVLTLAIAIIDNSQIFRMLKYQWGGHSSSATMCTSRMFVLAMIPLLIEMFNFPSKEDKPDIVYLNLRYLMRAIISGISLCSHSSKCKVLMMVSATQVFTISLLT